MEELKILYILNAMNSCDLDDRELRYKCAHSVGFGRPEYARDYEIFEVILEMKSQIRNVFFDNYQ